MTVKLKRLTAVVTFLLFAFGLLFALVPSAQAQGVGGLGNYCYVGCGSNGNGGVVVTFVESAVAEELGIEEGDDCPGAILGLLNRTWKLRGRDFAAQLMDGNGGDGGVKSRFAIVYEFSRPMNAGHSATISE